MSGDSKGKGQKCPTNNKGKGNDVDKYLVEALKEAGLKISERAALRRPSENMRRNVAAQVTHILKQRNRERPRHNGPTAFIMNVDARPRPNVPPPANKPEPTPPHSLEPSPSNAEGLLPPLPPEVESVVPPPNAPESPVSGGGSDEEASRKQVEAEPPTVGPVGVGHSSVNNNKELSDEEMINVDDDVIEESGVGVEVRSPVKEPSGNFTTIAEVKGENDETVQESDNEEEEEPAAEYVFCQVMTPVHDSDIEVVETLSQSSDDEAEVEVEVAEREVVAANVADRVVNPEAVDEPSSTPKPKTNSVSGVPEGPAKASSSRDPIMDDKSDCDTDQSQSTSRKRPVEADDGITQPESSKRVRLTSAESLESVGVGEARGETSESSPAPVTDRASTSKSSHQQDQQEDHGTISCTSEQSLLTPDQNVDAAKDKEKPSNVRHNAGTSQSLPEVVAETAIDQNTASTDHMLESHSNSSNSNNLETLTTQIIATAAEDTSDKSTGNNLSDEQTSQNNTTASSDVTTEQTSEIPVDTQQDNNGNQNHPVLSIPERIPDEGTQSETSHQSTDPVAMDVGRPTERLTSQEEVTSTEPVVNTSTRETEPDSTGTSSSVVTAERSSSEGAAGIETSAATEMDTNATDDDMEEPLVRIRTHIFAAMDEDDDDEDHQSGPVMPEIISTNASVPASTDISQGSQEREDALAALAYSSLEQLLRFTPCAERSAGTATSSAPATTIVSTNTIPAPVVSESLPAAPSAPVTTTVPSSTSTSSHVQVTQGTPWPGCRSILETNNVNEVLSIVCRELQSDVYKFVHKLQQFKKVCEMANAPNSNSNYTNHAVQSLLNLRKQSVDFNVSILRGKFPELGIDTAPLLPTDVELTIDEMADYYEMLLEGVLFTQKSTNDKMKSVASVMIMRMIRILHYFMITKSETQEQSELKFTNVCSKVLNRPILQRISSALDKSKLLAQVWDSVRLAGKGEMFLKGAVVDHIRCGPEYFKTRLVKFWESHNRSQGQTRTAPSCPNLQQYQSGNNQQQSTAMGHPTNNLGGSGTGNNIPVQSQISQPVNQQQQQQQQQQYLYARIQQHQQRQARQQQSQPQQNVVAHPQQRVTQQTVSSAQPQQGQQTRYVYRNQVQNPAQMQQGINQAALAAQRQHQRMLQSQGMQNQTQLVQGMQNQTQVAQGMQNQTQLVQGMRGYQGNQKEAYIRQRDQQRMLQQQQILQSQNANVTLNQNQSAQMNQLQQLLQSQTPNVTLNQNQAAQMNQVQQQAYIAGGYQSVHPNNNPAPAARAPQACQAPAQTFVQLQQRQQSPQQTVGGSSPGIQQQRLVPPATETSGQVQYQYRAGVVQRSLSNDDDIMFLGINAASQLATSTRPRCNQGTQQQQPTMTVSTPTTAQLNSLVSEYTTPPNITIHYGGVQIGEAPYVAQTTSVSSANVPQPRTVRRKNTTDDNVQCCSNATTTSIHSSNQNTRMVVPAAANASVSAASSQNIQLNQQQQRLVPTSNVAGNRVQGSGLQGGDQSAGLLSDQHLRLLLSSANCQITPSSGSSNRRSSSEISQRPFNTVIDHTNTANATAVARSAAQVQAGTTTSIVGTSTAQPNIIYSAADINMAQDLANTVFLPDANGDSVAVAVGGLYGDFDITTFTFT